MHNSHLQQLSCVCVSKGISKALTRSPDIVCTPALIWVSCSPNWHTKEDATLLLLETASSIRSCKEGRKSTHLLYEELMNCLR